MVSVYKWPLSSVGSNIRGRGFAEVFPVGLAEEAVPLLLGDDADVEHNAMYEAETADRLGGSGENLAEDVC